MNTGEEFSPQTDPEFQAEQAHLSATYDQLEAIQAAAFESMKELALAATADKESMAEELATNYATWDDAMETHADFVALNAIIDSYNLSHSVQAQRFNDAELLLRQPYFAKILLKLASTGKEREVYIGAAGIAGDDCKRLVVDWRSPVAEVYYNQQMGPTSYKVDGRTVAVDLKLRRQFDIDRNKLLAYFDSDVAIQDSLLLQSLSRQHSNAMRAITATIQREQNAVVRHEDVPVLLVNGIAGSGKTSVLMQRIAYLFYQERAALTPENVMLFSPNDVFATYIASVLPEMGESNPTTVTWAQFAEGLLPPDRGVGSNEVPPGAMEAIDAAVASFEFDSRDFVPVVWNDVELLSADTIRRINERFSSTPAGSHRVALIREELLERFDNRLRSMAMSTALLDEISLMAPNEQIQIFGRAIDSTDEDGAQEVALDYVKLRFGEARSLVENDRWLDVDHLGLHLLGREGLTSVEWIYLKLKVCGLARPEVRYVMVDEVQDYTLAQLLVLGTYFRRAHFLLLGDPNQAIVDTTATFDEIQELFERLRGEVARCSLMTSYRSTPVITDFFARLAMDRDKMTITSVQRDDEPVSVIETEDKTAYHETLTSLVAKAADRPGLTAVIVPWPSEAKRLAKELGAAAPLVLDEEGTLPEAGPVILPLKLAKGLEFDSVIIPDGSKRVFPDTPLGRRQLYTAASRATMNLTILVPPQSVSPLLEGVASTVVS